MTEQTKKPLKGDPANALKLSKDLLATLMESELYKNGRNNHLLVFDIMLGVAEFSAWVLKALSISSTAGDKFKEVYVKDILPTMLLSADDLDDILSKTMNDMSAMQSDVN